ncbi:polymorphic membrane protein G family [Candidatus Chlamydia sanziniae]|uniref:Polymorphic membrane protein G family n=2 Tax=Candidatus Chlamydia sanziniae TaxID=1806891 RepID=A0A1A9HV25_9CHLA|nr:polymorphic membrane protein G family [Candidatus Chlamydia sanziniae]
MFLRKCLTSTALIMPFTMQAIEIFMPSGNFDGLQGSLFPYTTLANPEGTTARFSGDLFIANVDDSISRTASSCFSNTKGALTAIGKGSTLSFTNIRTSTNGAAISNLVTDSPETYSLSFFGFKRLIFSNCEALTSDTATAGKTLVHSSAIYSTTPTIFKNNSTILFQHNRSAGSGSSINATSITLQGTEHSIIFKANGSITFGGVLTSTGPITFTKNTAPILFDSNAAAIYGGAIFLGVPTASLTSLGNRQGLTFLNNSARTGGAIFSYGNLTFTDNNQLIFWNNTASPENSVLPLPTTVPPIIAGYGGAIYCTDRPTRESEEAGTTPRVTLKGEQYITFKTNVSALEGGAIYGKKIFILSNGPTNFTRNISGKGAAIAIASSGELSLSADQGNIIFNENVTVKQGSSVTVTRNAIHFNENAKFALLGAGTDHGVFFYDPITSASLASGTTAPNLIINPKPVGNANINYQGRIVFSGETLTPGQIGNADNSTSTLHQKVTLQGGTLALKKGATLAVHTLIQEENSTIIMDAGTTLATTDGTTDKNTDGNIILTNLVINLRSLDATKVARVDVRSTSGTLTLSGSLGLIDDKEDFYENHGLLNQESLTLPIVELKTSTGTSTLSDFSLNPAGYTTSPYGYQGSWKLTWDATNKRVMGTWTKAGYIPSPRRLAPLVPNSLWGNLVDLRVVNQVATAGSDGFSYSKGFCLTGISNFFHSDRSAEARAYRHMSGGYLITANSQTVSDSIFGIGFGQLFTKSKDYLIANAQSKVYFGTVYSSFTQPLWFSTGVFSSFSARISYSRSNENLKTPYTNFTKGRASWSNNCWLGEFGGSFPIILSSPLLNLKQIVPFIQGEVAYAHHGKFQEKGTEGRVFNPGRLINVAIPLGIRLDKNSHRRPDFYSIMIAYVPDVYRRNPNCMTTLSINGAAWTSVATNLARHALRIQASSHTSVNNNIELFGHGGCDIRTTSCQYTLDVGSKLRF